MSGSYILVLKMSANHDGDGCPSNGCQPAITSVLLPTASNKDMNNSYAN